MPGVPSVTLAREVFAGPTLSEMQSLSQPLIPPIYMLGNRRRDSLRAQLNKCCLPAPPTIEKRVHVIMVKADRRTSNCN
jgi:hypothetical protein